MMNIKKYKERVMNHFKAFTDISKTTKEDWELLARLFLNASENGEEDMEEFDTRILTKQEFKELYQDTDDGSPSLLEILKPFDD